MLQKVTPTIENYLRLCRTANEQYVRYLENPPEEELDIIDWRVNYLPLDEFGFPKEFKNVEEVLLFKEYFEKSADYFYELMEMRERNNLTERVGVSLVTIPDVNLVHHFITAVSPREVASISIEMINDALLSEKYGAFYIDSPTYSIDPKDLSLPAVSVFICENGSPVFNPTTDLHVKGQLVVNSKKQVDFIEELNKAEVRIEVERVR